MCTCICLVSYVHVDNYSATKNILALFQYSIGVDRSDACVNETATQAQHMHCYLASLCTLLMLKIKMAVILCIQNFFQCVVYYVETSYQHLSDMHLQGKFSVTEMVRY